MFSSMHDSGEPDPYTWHCGCNVVKGTKIILQKFKELPLAERQVHVGPLLPADPYKPYRPQS